MKNKDSEKMKSKRNSCPEKCPRYNEPIESPCLRGVGPESCDIMIIGRDPGQNEDKEGKPFIGMAGKLLNRALQDSGVSRKEIFITNVVKCAHAGENKAPTKREIKSCRPFVVREIEKCKPKVIAVLGAEALESILGRTGITKLKNIVFISEEFNTKVIPIFHPAHILRNPHLYSEFEKGIQLLVKESESKKLINKPDDSMRILIADTNDKVKKVIDKLEKVPEFTVDLETSSLNPLKAKIGLSAISWDEDLGVIVPHDKLRGKNLARMKKVLLSDKLKINHNLKYDMEVFLANKFGMKKPFFDTIIAHSLIDENSDHGLGDCVLRYLDMGEYWRELEEYKKEKEKELGREINYLEIPKEILYPYAAKDAIATYRLYKIFKKKLKNLKLIDYFNKFSMETMPVLAQMELRGIRIDRKKLNKLIKEYEQKVVDLDTKTRQHKVIEKFEKDRWNMKLAGLEKKYYGSKMLQSRFESFDEYAEKSINDKDWKFNARSTPQMTELFYGKKYLKLKPIKFTDTKNPSTDKEVLEKFAKSGIEVASLISENRHLSAYLSNFLGIVYEKSEFDGRIHTNYIQHVVVTGRQASRDPNLQNLPEDADDFKDCFLADPGCLFVKGDLAQAEFRCWAHYSNDRALLNDIASGMDIHRKTASEVFGVPEDEVTPEQRTPAKRGTFGMMFGVSPQQIAEDFDIPLFRAKKINQTIYAKYPIAVEWLDEQMQIARKKGELRSWLGRIRRLPNIHSEEDKLRSKAERQARNCRIQMLASAMNDHYMVTILKLAKKKNIRCFPCMTIHDANIFQVEKKQVKRFIKLMRYVVATAFPDFRCKMGLDIEIGRTLGSLKKLD